MTYLSDYQDEIHAAALQAMKNPKRHHEIFDYNMTDLISRDLLLKLSTLHEMMVEERSEPDVCEWIYDMEGMNSIMTNYLLTKDDKYLNQAQDLVIQHNKEEIENDLRFEVIKFQRPTVPMDQDPAYMGATL